MRTYFIIGLIWIAVSGQAADSGSVNYNGVVSNVGCMAAANDQGPYCYFTVSSSLGCFGDVISFSANSDVGKGYLALLLQAQGTGMRASVIVNSKTSGNNCNLSASGGILSVSP